MRTTWRKELAEAMAERGEADETYTCTLTAAEMDKKFDEGDDETHGKPFTAWTEKSVYFPVRGCRAEWVGSVSRHPDGKPTKHQGGC